MNVVDSSGWIEYLAGGANAEHFRAAIEDTGNLIVPSLSLFQVYRHTLLRLGRQEALSIVAAMRGGSVMDLDDRVALEAAELSIATGLPTADSIILATARASGAELWTQDAEFEGMDDVHCRAKR